MSEPKRYSRGGLRWAVPSEYLDRVSATLLVFVKMLDALSMVGCFAVGIVVAVALISAVNSVSVSGVPFPALLLEYLRESGVPQQDLTQASQMLLTWSDLYFSGTTMVMALVALLPAVVVGCLEAVALIRVRIGMRGARLVSFLHRLYFVLGVIRIIGIVILSLALVLVGTQVQDGLGLMAAAIATGALMIGLRVPVLFYHTDVAWAMGEVHHELSTGKRAVITKTRLGTICDFYIAVEAIRTIGTIVLSLFLWVAVLNLPDAVPGAPAVRFDATFPVVVTLTSLWKILKYACVRACYHNFMNAGDGEERDEADLSRSTIVLGCGVVSGLSAVLIIFICIGVGAVSANLSRGAREFFEDALTLTSGTIGEGSSAIETTEPQPVAADAQQADAVAQQSDGTMQQPEETVQQEAV